MGNGIGINNASIHIGYAENGYVVTFYSPDGGRTIIAGCEHELLDVIADLTGLVDDDASDEAESTN